MVIEVVVPSAAGGRCLKTLSVKKNVITSNATTITTGVKIKLKRA